MRTGRCEGNSNVRTCRAWVATGEGRGNSQGKAMTDARSKGCNTAKAQSHFAKGEGG